MFARAAMRPVGSLNATFFRSSHSFTHSIPAKQSRTTPYVVGALVLAAGVYYIQRPQTTGTKSAANFNEGKEAAKDAPKTFTGGDQGFIKLKLTKSEQVNHNSRHLTFSFENPEAVSGLEVASALLTKFQPPDAEKPVIRPYTPVSAANQPGSLDLLVKKYPNGPMSTHLHELKVGESLEFKGPLPKYPMPPNKHTHIGMVAGGTGITPMYQVIRHVFANPDEKTRISLVYANQTEDDILLRTELSQLENQFPNRFKVFYLLDKPSEKWQGGSGFVNKEVLSKVLPKPEEEGVKVFVCGPPGMYKAVSGGKKSPSDQGELSGLLSELGYKKEQVFKF